jgi:hypothetical protein
MTGLTTAMLAQACRVFLDLAYPGGEATIPEKRRPYLRLAEDAPVAAYLPPAEVAKGIGQVLKDGAGQVHGYSLRLGSVRFPHLKLQMTDYNHGTAWVFAVDTHDAFPRDLLVEGSPDQQAWAQLQLHNRELKEAIERSWARDGLWTFHRLLQLDLDTPPSS